MLLFVALGLLVLPPAAWAQQKIAYIDSQYIYGKYPEFATAQQKLDRMAQDWQQELEQQQKELDGLFQEYQARELLYTQEERQRKQQEIMDGETQVERLRNQYFGPDGDLFKAIKAGAVSMATENIETFTETGIVFRSGELLEADLIVSATGLKMLFLAGLELTVDGERHVLGPGDAYYFDSSRPHHFRNVGTDCCEVVSACSPPSL